MAEKGDEREQPKPSPWETLASAQEAQPQNNNGWNRSDKWGQSLNDDVKWKSDGWGTSSGQKNRTRSRSSRSPTGDFRQLLNRGANWREDSPSPPHCGGNATRSQGTSLVCNNKTNAENENQPGLSSPRIKLPGHNDENRHNGRGPHSPAMTRSRLRSSSPFSHAAQEVNKGNIEKESDEWGMRSSHAERSKSRSLSPWSQVAHNIKGDSDSKDTDRWGKALDQTGLDAWNQTNSNDLLPNHDSDKWRGGHGAFRSRDRRFSTDNKWKRTGRDSSCSPEHKWRKTGQHLDRSRYNERSVSPENRPRRTGWDQGRSRGRGSTGPTHLSRFNRSPTDANKTKDEREKQLGFSYPQIKCSGLNEMTGSDRWGPESMKNSNQKESDWWGQDSSPVKKSRSRSVSPWSQAAVHINKDYKNKETDGWGTALDQTGPDAWNQRRSNLSPDRGFKRRGQKSRDQSHSPAPKWRKTGWHVDRRRPRDRDNSYSPDNKQRTGWNRGGSRSRGRGRTNSPYRCQKRREKRDSSYSPIRRSRRSPSLQRSPSRLPRMDQNREKRDGSEGRYEKKTNYRDNAAKVTSWEGQKWHDWSVNALRSSLKDPNLIYNWGDLANTGHGSESRATHTTTLHQSSTEGAVPRVAGNSTAILDAYCKTKQRGVVLEENISQELEISSQYRDHVKEKVGKNSPGIELPMNPMTSQWDNDVCIASSHATGTLSVNPTAPQSLSNQQNPVLVSKVGLSQTNQNCVAEKPNTDAVVQPVEPTPEVPKLGQSQLNQNLVTPNGTGTGEKTDEVDNHSFKLALAGFAKPKLKPFWLKRHLKEADYQQILHKFVSKVIQSLGTCVPQTHKNCCKFVKEQNDSLSKFLQIYLERFVSHDVIKNMRYIVSSYVLLSGLNVLITFFYFN
ncbi:uncharacterized protein LOC144544038 [Carex rostrata]